MTVPMYERWGNQTKTKNRCHAQLMAFDWNAKNTVLNKEDYELSEIRRVCTYCRLLCSWEQMKSKSTAKATNIVGVMISSTARTKTHTLRYWMRRMIQNFSSICFNPMQFFRKRKLWTAGIYDENYKIQQTCDLWRSKSRLIRLNNVDSPMLTNITNKSV